MANILALEWDSYEARIAVARKRGADVVIEHAFAVELAPRDAGETDADPNVGQRIAAALAARRIGRCDTMVAVGRSGVELRLLSVPPAPDAEIPELVRFQASRQFSALGDDWPLDFFPIDQQPDAPSSVLAAAISPELVGQIQQNCEAAQLRVGRLVLRPCSAASLWFRTRKDQEPNQVCLLVDILPDGADLTVTMDRTVVFMRSVRLPGGGNSPQQTQTLLGEIRRTRAAAQNQLGGQPIEQLVLFGPDDDHSALRSEIEEKVGLPSVAFDPFDELPSSAEVKRNPPPHRGRFAPLLGMLADEGSGTPHAIDFLHPRRKPEPVSRQRLYWLAGSVAATLVFALLGYLWMRLAALDHAIDQRKRDLALLENTTPVSERYTAEAAQMDKWVAGDVTWLDELYRLSTILPPPDDFKLTRLQIDADTLAISRRQDQTRVPEGQLRRRGRMRLEGYASDPDVNTAIEHDLRDGYHEVVGDGTSREGDDSQYSWRFGATMTVDLPEQDDTTPAQDKATPAQDEETATQDTETPTREEVAAAQEDETAAQEDETAAQEDETAAQEDETAAQDENATERDDERPEPDRGQEDRSAETPSPERTER